MSKRRAVPISTENFTRAEEEGARAGMPAGVPAGLGTEGSQSKDDPQPRTPNPEPLQAAALALAPQIRRSIDEGPKLKFAEAVLGNLSDEGSGYAASHVEVGNLKPAERDTLKRLRTGLSDNHVKLESGKHVESAADVVRWLLQQVATMARPLG